MSTQQFIGLPSNLSKNARILAVDPSLTCSGWAMFYLSTEKLIAVGKIKSLPPTYSMPERLKDFQDKVRKLYLEAKLTKDDIVICEAPTTIRDPRAAFAVEQIRCIFEDLAREKNATVPGRINPRTVHADVLGMKGKQALRVHVKQGAVTACWHLFGEELLGLGVIAAGAGEDALKKHQDIVDAVLIGYVAMRKR